MRRRSFALSLAVAVALSTVRTAGADSPPAPTPGDAPTGLALGDTIPMAKTSMAGVDGHWLSISEAGGKKGTLVVFMCHHCPWVKAWQDRIARIGSAAQKQGIGVIAINSNDPVSFPEDDLAGMKTQAKQLKLSFPYVVDATSDVARAFGATRTPEAFLFDASGKLVYHGTVDDNAHDQKAVAKPWLEQAVTAVAGGQAVPTAETKAFGCSIKFRAKSGT